MSTKQRSFKEQQRRREEIEHARQATTPRELPHTMTQRANMKRQGKQMHKQDGKR